MEIAVAGADALLLCKAANVGALPLRGAGEAVGRVWDVLALTSDASRAPLPVALCAKSLLLPGDSDPACAAGVHAPQLIGYGFSPRDTLTLSSLTGQERVLCLQRSLLTADGTLLEPQELLLSPALSSLPAEYALLVAGLRLLCPRARA